MVEAPCGCCAGLAGDAWTVGTGDVVGGLLAGGAGAATALTGAATADAEAFSYLFQSTRLTY